MLAHARPCRPLSKQKFTSETSRVQQFITPHKQYKFRLNFSRGDQMSKTLALPINYIIRPLGLPPQSRGGLSLSMEVIFSETRSKFSQAIGGGCAAPGAQARVRPVLALPKCQAGGRGSGRPARRSAAAAAFPPPPLGSKGAAELHQPSTALLGPIASTPAEEK